MIIAAAAWLLIAVAPAAATPPRVYQTHQMEMAGALELQSRGRFRYVFDYGSVSEASAGRWAVSRGTIRLVSDPRPTTADPERSWAAFASEPFAFDGTTVVMRRYDTVIRFVRVRP